MSAVILLMIISCCIASIGSVAYYFLVMKENDEEEEIATTPAPAVFGNAIKNIDFAGNDIQCYENDDDYETKCKDECEVNTDCAAYMTIDNNKRCCSKTGEALLGSGAKNYGEDSEYKFFVKNSILKEFEKHENKDNIGNDIKELTVLKDNIPALTAACSVTPTCKSFNTGGWLKTVNTVDDLEDSSDLDIYLLK